MSSTCSECGKPVPPTSLPGLCPECMLKVGLATNTAGAGTDETGAAAPPGPPTPSVEEVARLFPQLEVLECLGRGGMGAVYKARQPQLDRLVALKILLRRRGEDRADAAFAERFAREARALARLKHPAIVAVYDYGQAGGYPYLLLEFVEGQTLRHLLQRGKLAPEQALAIVPRICEALQYAHEQGVVHRDIKPENILVDPQGRVKIADFGIAKMLGESPARPALTADQQTLGTPHYMAPEQVEKPHSVDHRADIYSLGVVFYELLTGELPLGKFPPPSRKTPVDERLDQVVLHALEKEPERRYQHANEVQADVESIANTPADAPPVIPAGQVPAPVPARRRVRTACVWGLGGAAVLVLLAALAWGLAARKPGARSRVARSTSRGLPVAVPVDRRPPVPLPPDWTNALWSGGPEIVFPADASVVDVTQPPYNAKGDGQTDDTAAIQRALDDHPNQQAIIYLPHGTYLVSATLRWGEGPHVGHRCKRTTLQGQSRDGTVIKLKDACPGFTDPAVPTPVLWTGPDPPERYRNAVRNLTIDTGRDNPGAIGLQFNANFVGCVRDVLICSGDGQGAIGLDLSSVRFNGPLLVKNLIVHGFDVGIASHNAIMSQTFEHVLLANQNQVAFFARAATVSIRDLRTFGRVPAFLNPEALGLAVIVDSRCRCADDAGGSPAIITRAGLFVRNLAVEGFASAIAQEGSRWEVHILQEAMPAPLPGGRGPTVVPGPAVEAWTSHPLPGSKSSLNLAVKETPEVPWDPLDQWANVQAFGAQPNDQADDSEAIQQAIDSGKRTVYLPRGRYVLAKPVVLRGRVRRLIGCEAALRITAPERGQGIFTLADGDAPAVVVERLHADWEGERLGRSLVANASTRALVVCDCSGLEAELAGPGEVFLENSGGKIAVRGAKVWARQIHQTSATRHPPEEWWHLRNDGGTLWVLGNTTEGPGPVAITTGGGQTEILGGLIYSSAGVAGQSEPAFVVEAGALSVSVHEVSYKKGCFYPVLVRGQVNGAPTDLLMPALAPGGANASRIPLFSVE